MRCCVVCVRFQCVELRCSVRPMLVFASSSSSSSSSSAESRKETAQRLASLVRMRRLCANTTQRQQPTRPRERERAQESAQSSQLQQSFGRLSAHAQFARQRGKEVLLFWAKVVCAFGASALRIFGLILCCCSNDANHFIGGGKSIYLRSSLMEKKEKEEAVESAVNYNNTNHRHQHPNCNSSRRQSK